MRILLTALIAVTAACGSRDALHPSPVDVHEPMHPASAAIDARDVGSRIGVDDTRLPSIRVGIGDGEEVYIFDTPAGQVAALQARGHRVFCSFSAGRWESFRPDAGAFPAHVRGNTLPGPRDTRWLDIRSQAVFEAMLDRLDVAVTKGCDGVELDDATDQASTTGFALTTADRIAFNHRLARAARMRGLTIALESGVDRVVEAGGARTDADSRRGDARLASHDLRG